MIERLEPGVEIGGVSSAESAYNTPHLVSIRLGSNLLFAILEARGSGVAEVIMQHGELKGAIRRTAWIRKTPDGQYEVAPPGIQDPQAEGYLKTSMITPLDGAQGTVFAEMKQ